MPDDALRVRRLRLLAREPASGQGMPTRIEDALHVASRPPALANRFVLIRRLRLAVPQAASAQSIAMLLEREWDRVMNAAQFIDRASDGAEVVWALSEGHARLALLSRWLAGENDTAWFWRRIAPAAAHADQLLAQRAAALLMEPLADPAQSGSIAQDWWHEAMPLLLASGHARAVLEALPLERRMRLQAQPAGAAARRGAAASMSLPPAAAMPREATLPLAQDEPADGASVAGDFDRPRPAAEPAVPQPASRLAHGSLAGALSNEPPFAGVATDWAGLWLLVPVLLRNGFDTEAAAPGDPCAERQTAVFAALLSLLQRHHRFDAPTAEWVEALLKRTGLANEGALSRALESARPWWRTARQACAQHARLPLGQLLRRPGEMLVSPQRLDIVFPLRLQDIRVRRAGFDIDPGYLPWLDCVLRFHYR